MEILILMVTGIVCFIDALFEKWGIWDSIEMYGSQQKSKFIFDLTFCRFCMLFHIGWFITLIISCLWGLAWSHLAVPVICSGLIHLIQKR